MLFKRRFQESNASLRDKYLIQELIAFERYCRDQALWEEMKKCFDEKAKVNISWYRGSGWGFVEASQKMETHAPHKINNILVWLSGNKAVAECIANIQTRKEIDGFTYDLTSYARLHYKLIKDNGGDWFVLAMDAIYEKDTLIPMYPGSAKLDIKTEIKNYRPSYANLTYVLKRDGYAIDDTLPGEDRPELIAEMYKESRLWLEGEGEK